MSDQRGAGVRVILVVLQFSLGKGSPSMPASWISLHKEPDQRLNG